MEVWKDVPNYEGLYQVSNEGRVCSLPRISYKCYKKRGKAAYKKQGAFLTGTIQSSGYKIVGLVGGKKKLVHRLVMHAFRGHSDLSCNHIDGDKLNNHLSNLEYCSHKENIRHAFKNNLIIRAGEKNSQAKLTEKKVLQIRNLLETVLTAKEISKKFAVSVGIIYNIKYRKTWKHI